MNSSFSIENLLRPGVPELINLFEKLKKPTTSPETSIDQNLVQQIPFWYPAPLITLNQGIFFGQGNVVPAVFTPNYPLYFANPAESYRSQIGKIWSRGRANSKFSDFQRFNLERRFQLQKYLNKAERIKLAKKLNLGLTQEQRMVNLVASDGELISVSREAIRRSNTINDMMVLVDYDDVEEPAEPIPIRNINSDILQKMVLYLEHHIDDPMLTDDQYQNARDTEVSAWDHDFLDVDQETLFGMIMGADYLQIPNLYDLTCRAAARFLEGKPVEEIRRIFHIQNDYTPEEEAAIRRENSWAD